MDSNSPRLVSAGWDAAVERASIALFVAMNDGMQPTGRITDHYRYLARAALTAGIGDGLILDAEDVAALRRVDGTLNDMVAMYCEIDPADLDRLRALLAAEGAG